LPVRQPPSGILTFLFTDIEGSTRLWETQPQAMRAAQARHDAILRAAIESNAGYVFRVVGDAIGAVFTNPSAGLAAAAAAQRALFSETWDLQKPLRVRMALHTGAAEWQGADYIAPCLNRLARLLAIGYGGQTLVSSATKEMIGDTLQPGTGLRELGQYRLRDLAQPEHVYQLVVKGLPAEFPSLRSPGVVSHNLPAQLTSIIGRERELSEVVGLLSPSPDPFPVPPGESSAGQRRGAKGEIQIRLLTLTGPGGTGKTRLSLQAAASLLEDFPDGVYFVNLAPITDPALVASTIAQVLEVRETTGRPSLESLKDHLREMQILLLLDNFEQVAPAAPLVSDLLSSCPGLKVMITSRQTLHLRGEREYPVPPLSLPDPRRLPSAEHLSEYAAVELFIERALAVKPAFEITSDNARAVAELCYRLDGLPLAIEMAAARIKVLSPQAMLSRLSSRLKLLTGSLTDLPARQQTLRGTIAWSYDLLDQESRKLFRRLSVFVGGCTLEAAEALCGENQIAETDVFDGVASLVDKSLLRREERAGGESRFAMLETIREYGLECLTASGEAAAIRRRHASVFLELAREAAPLLETPEQRAWLDRLELEHDNLRAALRWAVEQQEADFGLELGAVLSLFWVMRGKVTEGREWLAALLSLPEAKVPTAASAKVLNGAGILARYQGSYAAARSLIQESLAIYRELQDRKGVADALANLGNVTLYQGDYALARSLYEESITINRILGNQQGIADALSHLGVMAMHQGDFPTARSLHEESLAIWKELGDGYGIAWALNYLGSVANAMGDYATAESLHQRSLSLYREQNNKQGIAGSLHNLGEVAACQDNYERAVALLDEGLGLFREMGDRPGIAASLNSLGRIASSLKDFDRAGALLDDSLALYRELGDRRGMAEVQCSWGSLLLRGGDPRRAAAMFEQSLTVSRELGCQPITEMCLLGLARIDPDGPRF
jgi:predicted ATPase/class 3 adenylate cyclase